MNILIKIDSEGNTRQWRGDTLDNQSEESREGANHEPLETGA